MAWLVGLHRALDGRGHRKALYVFLVVVLGHWAEHLLQAYEVYVLGWSPARARGALGMWFPELVTSEWLHYGYNLAVLLGLALLLGGFQGRAHAWWAAALSVQAWHHLEHLLLLAQALTGYHLLGRSVPTSILQLWVPRLELHQAYNAVVLIPLLVGLSCHRRPLGGRPSVGGQEPAGSAGLEWPEVLRSPACAAPPRPGS